MFMVHGCECKNVNVNNLLFFSCKPCIGDGHLILYRHHRSLTDINKNRFCLLDFVHLVT